MCTTVAEVLTAATTVHTCILYTQNLISAFQDARVADYGLLTVLKERCLSLVGLLIEMCGNLVER
jgi:hypothetical protein